MPDDRTSILLSFIEGLLDEDDVYALLEVKCDWELGTCSDEVTVVADSENGPGMACFLCATQIQDQGQRLRFFVRQDRSTTP